MSYSVNSPVRPFDLGTAFSPNFTAALPELEKRMEKEGFDLSKFALVKRERQFMRTGSLPLYDYTTSIDGEEFTVTFSDDMQFLAYLTNLCLAPVTIDSPFVVKNKRPFRHLNTLFGSISRWLNADPLQKERNQP